MGNGLDRELEAHQWEPAWKLIFRKVREEEAPLCARHRNALARDIDTIAIGRLRSALLSALSSIVSQFTL